MRFNPFVFYTISTECGNITHEIRSYKRSASIKVISRLHSLEGRVLESVSRTTTEFLRDCGDDEKDAFDRMIKGRVEEVRRLNYFIREYFGRLNPVAELPPERPITLPKAPLEGRFVRWRLNWLGR